MIAARQIFLGTSQSNAEEEMYKEMYTAMITGVSSFGDTLIDNVSTTIRSGCFWTFPNTITKLVFNKAAGVLNVGAFRNATHLQEIDIPLVTSCGNTAFNACSSLVTLRADVCKNFGSNGLTQCAALSDVYAEQVNFAETISFPWGVTNSSVVFHFKDGNYDYTGSKLT